MAAADHFAELSPSGKYFLIKTQDKGETKDNGETEDLQETEDNIKRDDYSVISCDPKPCDYIPTLPIVKEKK